MRAAAKTPLPGNGDSHKSALKCPNTRGSRIWKGQGKISLEGKTINPQTKLNHRRDTHIKERTEFQGKKTRTHLRDRYTSSHTFLPAKQANTTTLSCPFFTHTSQGKQKTEKKQKQNPSKKIKKKKQKTYLLVYPKPT
jgi:hypothetical protein